MLPHSRVFDNEKKKKNKEKNALNAEEVPTYKLNVISMPSNSEEGIRFYSPQLPAVGPITFCVLRNNISSSLKERNSYVVYTITGVISHKKL